MREGKKPVARLSESGRVAFRSAKAAWIRTSIGVFRSGDRAEELKGPTHPNAFFSTMHFS